MKLLYGVQATGNGHLARARALTPALRKADIDVDFIFTGRAKDQLFNMDIFGEDYRCFEGLTFISEKGKIQALKTLTQNKPLQFIHDVKNLDVSGYDLVLSDFEPVTAWAAKLQGVPSLSVSHQSAFQLDVPKVSGNLLSRALMQWFAPTDYHVGLHWYHFNQAVFPPLVEPFQLGPIVVNKIVIYMGFEALDDIIELLQPFTHCHFVVYANVKESYRLNHILVEPLSHSRFHEDLLSCDGVISNAGFELASECITLGKKLLVKPLHCQYEQLCNAKALEALGRGTVMDQLCQKTLAKWLEQESPRPVHYPDVATAIAKWIKAKDFNNTDTLQHLWRDIEYSLAPLDAAANLNKTLALGLR